MIGVEVKVETVRLLQLIEKLEREFRTPIAGSHIQAAFKQWAARYRAAMQDRFARLSRGGGGGEWPALKARTVARRLEAPVRRQNYALRRGFITQAQYDARIVAARRRVAKAKKKIAEVRLHNPLLMGHVSILRDTGTLFAALHPTIQTPGQFTGHIPLGVRVGFGGPAGHPSGRMTIARLAAIHHFGGRGGRPPARPILVSPPEKVRVGMARDLEVALARMIRDVSGGAK